MESKSVQVSELSDSQSQSESTADLSELTTLYDTPDTDTQNPSTVAGTLRLLQRLQLQQSE